MTHRKTMKDLHAQFDAKGKSMTNRPIRKKGKERERERKKESMSLLI